MASLARLLEHIAHLGVNNNENQFIMADFLNCVTAIKTFLNMGRAVGGYYVLSEFFR